VSERIQKALANAGLGSRRTIERWVIDGRITIDGRTAQLGDQVRGRERICVDGRQVKLASTAERHSHQHLAYYKTGDSPRARRDLDESDSMLEVPRPRRGRWIDVGALDPNTSGLIVLTSDGELAYRLMRPATVIEREYAVRLLGEPSPEQLRELMTGVDLDEGRAKFESVDAAGGGGNNFWYRVVLRESRHRALRLAFGAVGLAVSRIIRVRFGPIELGKLRRGTSRPLASTEVDALYGVAGLSPPRTAPAKTGAAERGARATRRPRAARSETRGPPRAHATRGSARTRAHSK
jgi:23S rRNA pseudouridine2605 synthase